VIRTTYSAERVPVLLAVMAASLVVVACSAGGEEGFLGPGQILGTWGGKGVLLTAGSGSAAFLAFCADGSIDRPIWADAAGRFEIEGTYTIEGPGPARQPFSAIFQGEVSGRTLVLTITKKDTGETIGTFTLTLGNPGQVNPCPLV
jgi:hypothetical protein